MENTKNSISCGQDPLREEDVRQSGRAAHNLHLPAFPERVDAGTKCAIVAATAVLAGLLKGPVPLVLLWLLTLGWASMLGRAALLVKVHAVVAVLFAVACGFAMGIGVGAEAGVGPAALGAPFLRGLALLNVVLVLALSSKVEDLMAVLERLRLPFVVYLPAAVMIRFIPTFMEDVRMVRAALRMKGVDARFWASHPLEGARMALMPVLFRALRSSENLGLAAEMKGVTGRLSPKPRPPVTKAVRAARRGAAAAVLLTIVVWATMGELFVPDVAMPG